MGFIKDLFNAAYGSYEGALADSWLESITCDEYKPGQLMANGHIQHSKRGCNTSGTPDVITDGSKIFVGPNETAIVIENGKIVYALAEPGYHTFHSEQTKGFFSGNSMGEGLKNINEDAKERFTYGGDKAVVQMVLYINQKEIPGNEFCTDWIPIRIHVPSINYDVDCSCMLAGQYSFRIVDAVAFYKNFVGNREGGYYAASLVSLINSVLLTGIQSAIPRLFSEGTRPSAMIEYVDALAKAICEETTKALGPERGIGLVSCGISSFVLQGADLHYLQRFERDSVLKDPTMAAAHLAGATADAMQTIAYSASAGAGPTGYGLIGAALLAQRKAEGIEPEKPKARMWHCNCGKYVRGKFCGHCGQQELFECRECGTATTGKFCPNCGHNVRR